LVAVAVSVLVAVAVAVSVLVADVAGDDEGVVREQLKWTRRSF
jgi:hypothetical protein